MDGARTILAITKMPDVYWPYAVTYKSFKHSFLKNSTTYQIPFNAWTRAQLPLPLLCVFGHLGYIPNLPYGVKCQTRRTISLYVGINDRNHVMVQLPNVQCKKIRLVDVHPSHKSSGPTETHTCAFIQFTKYKFASSRIISMPEWRHQYKLHRTGDTRTTNSRVILRIFPYKS